MGLLDDAIREHLDLKRRRGADPAEIERAEREALGPVRRNRDTGLPDDPEALSEPNGGEDEELGHDDELVVEGSEHEVSASHPPPGPAYDEPDEPIAGDLAEEDESLDDDNGLEEEPRTRVMRAADIPIPDDATTEYDVEEALAAEDVPPADDAPDTDDVPAGPARSAAGAPPSAEDGEDVLEETPEFLQDTPDHDRLWFEQRPPRDFDFDS